MLKNENLLFISDVNWDAHQVCEQNLLREFAVENRTMYIERPVSFLAPFTAFGIKRTAGQLKRWITGGVREENKIIIVTPPPCLPIRYNRLINYLNQMIRASRIKRYLTKFNMNNPIVITFEPDSALLQGRLGEKVFIYYRNDDHENKKWGWNSSSAITKYETRLISNCAGVLSLSEGFVKKARKLNKNILIAKNGVSREFLSIAQASQRDIPLDLRNINRPIIGFLGILDYRLDIQLLIEVANRKPNWSFVFVGIMLEKRERQLKELFSLPNTYYLGRKSINEIPRYIRAMDICLIPIIISERTKNVLSIKLFEYSALGKPIVAAKMPELQKYSEYVYFYLNADEFIENIELAMAENDQEKVNKRIKFASMNTWNNRAEQISDFIVQNLLNNNKN